MTKAFSGTQVTKETDSKVASNFRQGIFNAATEDSIDSKKVPGIRSSKDTIKDNMSARVWNNCATCP